MLTDMKKEFKIALKIVKTDPMEYHILWHPYIKERVIPDPMLLQKKI